VYDMAPERTGGGDPARTLALLWGVAPAKRRGPRPGLTVGAIVRAAVETADRDGLAEVSMRRLAGALGVGPMSLYTYVPGRAELLDLMLDAVYAAMPRAPWGAVGWRERVTAVARDNRELYERHPWAAAVGTSRPPLGPGQLAKYDHELRALTDTGLDDVELDAALTFVLDFVRSHARAAQDVRAARGASGQSDEEWWEAFGPLLSRVLDPDAYPTAARVGTAAGAAQDAAYDPDAAWAFGLERVLDGLGALVERRAAVRPSGGTSPSA